MHDLDTIKRMNNEDNNVCLNMTSQCPFCGVLNKDYDDTIKCWNCGNKFDNSVGD